MATAYGCNFAGGDKARLQGGSAYNPGTSDHALSVWLNPVALAYAVQFIFSTGATANGADGLGLAVGSSGILYLYYNDSAQGTRINAGSLSALGAITTGAWQHVAVNFDRDGNATAYLNGVEQLSVSIAAHNADLGYTHNPCVGQFSPSSTAYPWQGSLANLDLHNRLYTSSDIALLYNGGRLRPYALYPASLKVNHVSHYAFNGGGGVDGVAFDSTHQALDSVGGNHLSFAAADIINATTLNGGFETAGAGGADVLANWIEAVAGSSTVNRDTTGGVPYAGSACCRMDIDSSGSSAFVYQAVTTSGRSYNYTTYAKGATGTPSMRVEAGATVFNSHTLSSSWQQFSGALLATGANFGVRRNSATSNSIFLDNITLAAAEIPTAAGPEIVSPFAPWILRRRRRMAGAR